MEGKELDQETNNFEKQTDTPGNVSETKVSNHTEEVTAAPSDNIPFIITNLEDSEEKPYDYESQIITTADNEELTGEAVENNDSQPKQSLIPKEPIQKSPKMDAENENTVPPRKKSHKKLLWGCIFTLFLLSSLSAVGWSFYSEIKAAERQEALDLAVLCKENYNIEDYQNFLKKYTQSEHCRSVRQRLRILERMEEDWNAIEKSNNENSFVDFKNKYKDPYYSRLCNMKIDSIDWTRAKLSNTPDAYQRYMNRHPSGTYINEAYEAKCKVAYMNISEQEQYEIRMLCNRFFNAIGVNNTAELGQYFAPRIKQFMTLINPSLEDVFEWTSKNQENHSFVNYYIHDDFKMSKDISEYNEEFFNLAFTIDEITTNETGVETTKPFAATLLMNKDHQIYNLVFRQIQ